jgi:phosphatidylinositol glycan class W
MKMSAKDLKEAFVTGHTGTTTSEILLVCMSSPIGIFLFQEIRHYLVHREIFYHKSNFIPISILILLESMTVLLPMAICQTEFLLPYGVIYLSFELLLGFVLHIYRWTVHEIRQEDDSSTLPQASPSSKMEFLTFYRSTVNYLTFVAILAVDFTIFPRSYAKTESYGYGLMDLGAASFCAIGGLVSWFAKSQFFSTLQSSKNITGTSSPKPKFHEQSQSKMKKVFMNSIPLIIMGMIRLITTKGLEYQEHVSEYGVHWNFFFTLAMVNILATFIRSYSKLLQKPIVPWFTLLILYQSLLSLGNVQQYIESAPRVCAGGQFNIFCTFFAANREGLLGSIGYLILFLACEDIGKYCIWKQRVDQPSLQGFRIFMITIIFWFLHWLSSSTRVLGIVVSRRSTNTTFILWTIAHNMTILFLIWMVFYNCSKDSIHNNSASIRDHDKAITPPIFAAVNKHGLIVFILANLLTGAVNLTVDTLKASKMTAILIIFCYLCSVGGVALLVNHILSYRSREKTKT